MALPQYSPGILGFKFYWAGDQVPAVTTTNEELAQQIVTELAIKAPALLPLAHCLHDGVPLPYFWAVIKASDLLKCDMRQWWHLDECAKHLLASWIVSHPIPKRFIADSPILWEIYPTMIVGSTVQARIRLSQGFASYELDPTAETGRYLLYSWAVNVDVGHCVLLDGGDQLTVEFNVADLADGSLIRLDL